MRHLSRPSPRRFFLATLPPPLWAPRRTPNWSWPPRIAPVSFTPPCVACPSSPFQTLLLRVRPLRTPRGFLLPHTRFVSPSSSLPYLTRGPYTSRSGSVITTTYPLRHYRPVNLPSTSFHYNKPSGQPHWSSLRAFAFSYFLLSLVLFVPCSAFSSWPQSLCASRVVLDSCSAPSGRIRHSPGLRYVARSVFTTLRIFLALLLRQLPLMVRMLLTRGQSLLNTSLFSGISFEYLHFLLF